MVSTAVVSPVVSTSGQYQSPAACGQFLSWSWHSSLCAQVSCVLYLSMLFMHCYYVQNEVRLWGFLLAAKISDLLWLIIYLPFQILDTRYTSMVYKLISKVRNPFGNYFILGF